MDKKLLIKKLIKILRSDIEVMYIFKDRHDYEMAVFEHTQAQVRIDTFATLNLITMNQRDILIKIIDNAYMK